MEAVMPNRTRWIRPVLILVVLVAGVILARALGVTDFLRLENLARVKKTIAGYGAAGPLFYIAGYVLAVVFFVPGLPITLLGGLAFGPVWGTVYVSIAATIGAGLAFLVARYGLRGMVERWVRSSPRLARMDAAVARDGWRIVMITRLVPLFPFNLQNYAYGLTRIGFWTYLLTSWICMLPGTAAYTFAGGALSEGGGDLRRTLGYLAIAGVLIVLVSLIPRFLQRRSQAAGEFLRSVVVVLAAGGLVASGAEPAAAMASAAYVSVSASSGETAFAQNIPRRRLTPTPGGHHPSAGPPRIALRRPAIALVVQANRQGPEQCLEIVEQRAPMGVSNLGDEPLAAIHNHFFLNWHLLTLEHL